MYKILVLTVVLLLKITNSYAEVIKNIEIVGNNRVSKATILNFSDLKKGDDVSLSNINESLKSLYNTNFFEDIKVSLETGNIGSFDEYKFATGQIKGLAFMEDTIRRAMNNIELADE